MWISIQLEFYISSLVTFILWKQIEPVYRFLSLTKKFILKDVLIEHYCMHGNVLQIRMNFIQTNLNLTTLWNSKMSRIFHLFTFTLVKVLLFFVLFFWRNSYQRILFYWILLKRMTYRNRRTLSIFYKNNIVFYIR